MIFIFCVSFVTYQIINKVKLQIDQYSKSNEIQNDAYSNNRHQNQNGSNLESNINQNPSIENLNANLNIQQKDINSKSSLNIQQNGANSNSILSIQQNG
jgi:hypothetical protein